MSEPLILDLPYPISINHYYGVARSGRRFLTKPAHEYREQVAAWVAQQAGRRGFTGPLEILIDLYPIKHKNGRVPDWDNGLKALCDAMEHAGVFKNDNQIIEGSVKRFESVTDGLCRVSISEVGKCEN
jgi:crossover junction endodeoxyribonuclease RusA